MAPSEPVLLTGVGGGPSSISRLTAHSLLKAGQTVRLLIHRDDGRADDLRRLGAEVVVGDLADPQDVADALRGVHRVFFNMAVSSDYLRAAAVMSSVAVELGELHALVNMSQLTVAQMTATSSDESDQQRLHWLVERIEEWAPLPVVNVRPTVFMDNPMFSIAPRQLIASANTLALPIGAGRTSPVAATDVAAVVSSILLDPSTHVGRTYELTGPESLNLDELAERYGRALGRTLSVSDIPLDVYERMLNSLPGLPSHVRQHIYTVAKLHRAGRYDRSSNDVELITGKPAQSLENYIAHHRELFFGGSAG
ncbi:NmrA family NAD(P)-binding protein [Leifsonia sp. fls2-241-R2A-40a]|uniref:NmrA family NAD(P)-binding protein n=1 Tax=Leifsonia sp. fls2-241-R2A-40a TaxID=3040290 RepID=UPI00254E46AA|nr:NmrA family NAD(P)-binding protein [Leifsonia sp. fls2-241-R2A-40a]